MSITRAEEHIEDAIALFKSYAKKGLEDKEKIKYECEECKDMGVITKTLENGQEVGRQCPCVAIKANLRRVKMSGFSDSLNKLTFDGFKTTNSFQSHMKERALEFINQDEYKAFFIGGQVGCGKTHICTAICKHFINNKMNTLYVSYSDMIAKLKACANEEYAYEEELRKYANVEVLYIDDLFKTRTNLNLNNDFADVRSTDIRHLFNVINYRYINDKTTVISSEFLLSEILSIDESIGSRIAAMCGKKFRIDIGRDKERNYRLR